MTYVAYTDMGAGPGAPIEEKNFSPEDWQYMVDHGMVVLQGSENDPNVLAARAAGEAYVDPRDTEIARLKEELAALKGEDKPTSESKDLGTSKSSGEPKDAGTNKPGTPVDTAPPSDATKS